MVLKEKEYILVCIWLCFWNKMVGIFGEFLLLIDNLVKILFNILVCLLEYMFLIYCIYFYLFIIM